MYRLGFDIGGTHIACGIINDETFEIVGKDACAFFRGQSAEKTAQCMAELAKNTAARCGTDFQQIETVGVCIPGSIDAQNGTVVNAYNLGFHDVPLKKLIEAHFLKTPVFMANDANGAALAELYKGAFVGCKTAVLLTLGTGLGGGIILNGKMFNGGMNQGVELGHAYLVDDGEYCTCGNHGCMEAYCAASALAREGARAMQSDPRGLLAERSGGNAALIDAKMVVDCAKAGDVTAKRVFDEYIGHLSSACASFFNILDPEVLAIGGGLCGAGEFLFAPLRERVTEKCFYKSHGAVVPAVMGNDAGIIGAAMLRRDTELR